MDFRASLAFQTDLSRRPLQIPLGQHQIGQPKQTEQLRRILFQSTVANLSMIETHLDYLEGMLDLGAQLRLGVFYLVVDPEQHAAFAVVLVTAWPRCNRPENVPFSMLRSRGRTGVSSVTRNLGFGTVQ